MRYEIYQTRLKAALAKRAKIRACGVDVGTQCLSATDMLESIWDLFGDGRSIIDPLQRSMIISDLIAQTSFQLSLGTVSLVCDFIERSAHKIFEGDIDAAMDSNKSLSGSEIELCSLVRSYHEALRSRDLIELGAATVLIEPFKHLFDIDIPYPLQLDEPMSSFYGQGSVDTLVDGSDVLAERASFGFVAVSGSSIQPSALLDRIAHDADELSPTSMLAACMDPVSVLKTVCQDPRFSEGFDIGFRCGIALSDTRFGNLLRSMQGIFGSNDRRYLVGCATDFVLSDYSDIGSFTLGELYGSMLDSTMMSYIPAQGGNASSRLLSAGDLNTIWRQDRALGRRQIEEQLRYLSRTFVALGDIFAGRSDDTSVFDHLISCLAARSDSYVKEFEMAAISKAKDAVDVVISLGIDRTLLLDMVLGLEVPVDIRSATHGSVMLNIMDHKNASQMIPKSFDMVYLDDVSSNAFNSKDHRSSVDLLLEKMDSGKTILRSDAVSSMFASIVGCASKKFTAFFPLRDGSGQENFTSFAFDAMVGSLSSGDMDTTDLIGKCREGESCSCLLGHEVDLELVGEERLQKGIGRQNARVADEVLIEASCRGTIDADLAGYLHRRIPSTNDGAVVLSASSIEGYMGCPYRWFIERRLKAADVQEGIGSLERGVFLHRVLELFFSKVMALDVARGDLRAIPVDRADEMVDEAYDRALSEQRHIPLGEARYIPISEVESIEDEIQRATLKNSIRLMRELPMGYSCSEIEKVVNAEECAQEGIDYAGAYFNGKIDRIDVSMDGSSFYVIDYKGSIRDHAAGSSRFDVVEDGSDDDRHKKFAPEIHPDHIQALIYSSLYNKIQDALDAPKRCKGAIYCSYRNDSSSLKVAGSCSPDFGLSAKEVEKGSIVDGVLDDFLDMVERLVSVYVGKLASGNIAASPNDKSICASCIYRQCEARL